MPPRLTGIGAAFAEPILQGWATVLDNHLADKLSGRLTALVFFSASANLVFLPIIIYLSPPALVSGSAFALLLVVAAIEVLYQYPYYRALRCTDTSVVNALFSLGKIFVPVFAFFVVGERIGDLQYLGFVFIAVSSVGLVLDFKSLQLNAAFFLMLFVAAILSLESVLIKYLYSQGVGWSSYLVWSALIEFALAGGLFLWTHRQRGHGESVGISRNTLLLCVAQLLTWGGEAAGSFAIYLIPVSVAKGITGTQPVFVLLYALLLGYRIPSVFKEERAPTVVLKKAVFLLLMIAGTIFIVRG